jgi:uncharacterized protein
LGLLLSGLAAVVGVLIGTVAYTMRGVVPWPMLGRLGVGLVPGAFVAGAAETTRIRAERLRTLVALACVAAGILLTVRAVGVLA